MSDSRLPAAPASLPDPNAARAQREARKAGRDADAAAFEAAFSGDLDLADLPIRPVVDPIPSPISRTTTGVAPATNRAGLESDLERTRVFAPDTLAAEAGPTSSALVVGTHPRAEPASVAAAVPNLAASPIGVDRQVAPAAPVAPTPQVALVPPPGDPRVVSTQPALGAPQVAMMRNGVSVPVQRVVIPAPQRSVKGAGVRPGWVSALPWLGLALAAVGGLVALAHFAPGWWSELIGGFVNRNSGLGAALGVGVGFSCTLATVLLVNAALRRWSTWRKPLVLVIGALLVSAPNVLTLWSDLALTPAAREARASLDRLAPLFRGASLWGAAGALVIGVLIAVFGRRYRRRGHRIAELETASEP